MRQFFPLLIVFAAGPLAAQIITGSIAGRIEDPGGAVVPDAQVTLTRVATGLARQAKSNLSGEFVFTGLDAGEYRLAVSKTGFKQVEKSGLVLPSGVRLAAGTIQLELGQLADTVTVTAEAGALVQTQSAERADVITSSQVENLQIIGRNVPSLVGLLPGVVVTEEPAGLDRRTIFNALGNRNTANQVTVDGLPSTDLGNSFALKLQPSMDSVAEVRILLSNYQAEYGNAAGASVEMVLKSGTRDFHGLGSYFKRHEQFNANNFFNNRLGVPKPRYRYNTWTYNIGGPVYIPGKFNRDRDRLFFFWAQEFWPRKDAGAYRITVPTELERAGDFSQTLDVNNRLIVIRDPSNNQAFAGNRIPAARIDKNSQSLMNLFPKPNFFDRGLSGGQYNHVFTSEMNAPKRATTLKLDYNFSSRSLLFFTFSAYREFNEGYIAVPGWAESFEQYFRTFWAGNKGAAIRHTYLFSPTVSNEFHFGWFANPETLDSPEADIRRNQRDTVGFLAGQFFPQNNPLNLIPNATYGGVPGAASLTINGRFPINDPYNTFTFTDKLSIVRGAHTAKMGILVNWYGLGRGINSNQFGSFNYARNVNNPLDSNWAYSNAILGVFNTYTESSAIPYFNIRGGRTEWFAQDNWRVRKRLTLDYGVRMSRFIPIHDRDNRASAFVPDRYDPSQRVQLIAPGRDSRNVRVGVHPVTGQIYPESLIGAIAPGVGNPANGMVLAGTDPNLPKHFIKQRGWQAAPRLGFALDVFGNGRTALRGGFGMFYEQAPTNSWQAFVNQEPLVRNPNVFFGSVATLLSSAGLLFPTNVTAADPAGHLPTVMNFSFSIQQNVGFGTVVDVGYVGSLGRHLLWSRDLNAIPYGANFLRESIDPTTSRPYPAAFLRPVVGFNNITMLEHAATSNYHSLQVSANRRFARSVQFGFAWTWSKAMDFVDSDGGGVAAFVPVRVWNYGLAGFDRTHTVKINWLYDLPQARWNHPIAKAALRGWQMSGITTFQSGAPLGIGYSLVTAVDITGSPTEGSRVVVLDNPVLPKSERTFDRFFRTDVFQPPAVGTWGNAAKTLVRGPGINNWDISVFKNFQVRESMRLQLRCEAYNAFNHTQFSGVNTAARFDAAGRQVNTVFGQMTSARNPRLMQLALRFLF